MAIERHDDDGFVVGTDGSFRPPVLHESNDVHRFEACQLLVDVLQQYGSVQRTMRHRDSFNDDETVLEAFEETGIDREQVLGIDREQVLGIDREQVDETLDVVGLSESTVYGVSESEYVRKADDDEKRKQTRLQGLKDRPAGSDDPEAAVLCQEVDRLEQEIEELAGFPPGSSFGSRPEGN